MEISENKIKKELFLSCTYLHGTQNCKVKVIADNVETKKTEPISDAAFALLCPKV
jgi:hypothetical protein